MIIPVFKKGDINDLNNCISIMLVSNLAKLFTAVLNQKLIKWSQNNDIITDAQFGFRPGYATVDAILFYILLYHILWQIRKCYTVYSSILKWLLSLLIDVNSSIK